MTNETEAPERIWVTWPQPNSTGLAFSCQARPPARRTEYTHADLCDAQAARIAELEAEREKWIAKWSQEHYEVIAQRFRAEAAEAKLAKALEAMTEVRDDCIARADKNDVVPIGRSAWDQLTATLAELQKPIATRDDPA